MSAHLAIQLWDKYAIHTTKDWMVAIGAAICFALMFRVHKGSFFLLAAVQIVLLLIFADAMLAALPGDPRCGGPGSPGCFGL